MKPTEAKEQAQNILLTDEQAQRVQAAVQQRTIAQLQLDAAQLAVSNTVQAIALELKVDPAIYPIEIQSSAAGLAFVPKKADG